MNIFFIKLVGIEELSALSLKKSYELINNNSNLIIDCSNTDFIDNIDMKNLLRIMWSSQRKIKLLNPGPWLINKLECWDLSNYYTKITSGFLKKLAIKLFSKSILL